MWVMTTRGFYSVVQDRDQPQMVLIRARCEEDIRNLADLIPGREPVTLENSDYHWRLSCTAAEWVKALAEIALEIDYTNFKNAVAKVSPKHANVYHSVWSVLLKLSPTGSTNWSGGGGLFRHEKTEAVRLSGEGMTDAEIAKELGAGVTTRMVRAYLTSRAAGFGKRRPRTRRRA